jgi:2-phosphoglycerate kinase
MSDALIRTTTGTRSVTVAPSIQAPADAALTAVAIELQRLMRRAAQGPLSREEAQNLALYVKAIKDLRDIQKDLAKDTDVDRMTLDELRELAQSVIKKLTEKEEETK